MFDLRIGIEATEKLMRHCLAQHLDSLLTPERVFADLSAIKQCLVAEVSVLSYNDLVDLFPVILYLEGYELDDEQVPGDLPSWKLKFVDPGGVTYHCLAAIVREMADLPILRRTARELNCVSNNMYIGMLEHGSWKQESARDSEVWTESHDLADFLFAVATIEYLDVFVYTLASAPAFRSGVQAAIAQCSRLSLEHIMNVSARWKTLLESVAR